MPPVAAVRRLLNIKPQCNRGKADINFCDLKSNKIKKIHLTTDGDKDWAQYIPQATQGFSYLLP